MRLTSLIAVAVVVTLFGSVRAAEAQNPYAQANSYAQGPYLGGYSPFGSPYGSNVVLQNPYAGGYGWQPIYAQTFGMNGQWGYGYTPTTPDVDVETVPGSGVVIGPNGQTQPLQPPAQAQNILPRTSDIIEANLDPTGKVWMGWQGETRAVNQIEFSLLDSGRNVIADQLITSPPAEARLTPTSRATYYRVVIEYINGATMTVISPIPTRQEARK